MSTHNDGLDEQIDDGADKMSEILVDISDPLVQGLELPEHLPTYRALLTLSSAIWNVSRMSEGETRRENLDLIVGALVEQMECPKQEAQHVVGAVYLRARQHFEKDEKRLMESVEVEMSDDTHVRINVRSAEV